MDEQLLTLIRELGPVGIIALALLGMSRAIRPAIESIAHAQRDSADARREQSKTNEAVLRRWEESDKTIERNNKEHVDALGIVADRLKDLHITDTQRVKQNDVIHGVINGMNTNIQALPKVFETGKNDAVDKVNKAMDDKLKPIEQTLQSIQKQVSEALVLLHSVTAERVPLQTQEHHHTGSVTLTPPAAPDTKDAGKDTPDAATD